MKILLILLLTISLEEIKCQDFQDLFNEIKLATGKNESADKNIDTFKKEIIPTNWVKDSSEDFDKRN